MRRATALLLTLASDSWLLTPVSCLLISGLACAQNASSPAGKWISKLTLIDKDNVNYDRLQLELNGTKLTGKLGNNAFEGTFQNGRIEGTMKPGPQTTFQFTGTLDGDRIRGSALVVEPQISFTWEASREPARSPSPQTHTFEPTEFQHFFTDSIAPVLHINPGTGPFYVEGALRGDAQGSG
jgi:amidase